MARRFPMLAVEHPGEELEPGPPDAQGNRWARRRPVLPDGFALLRVEVVCPGKIVSAVVEQLLPYVHKDATVAGHDQCALREIVERWDRALAEETARGVDDAARAAPDVHVAGKV